MAREEFVLQLKLANPVSAKVPHIPAQAAIGDEMPVVRVVNQAKRFDLAVGHITTLTSLVLQRQNAAFGEGALDGNQGFTRQSRDRVRSTGNHGGRAFQAVEII